MQRHGRSLLFHDYLIEQLQKLKQRSPDAIRDSTTCIEVKSCGYFVPMRQEPSDGLTATISLVLCIGQT